ncbi:hypothetical protein C0J52_22073 [Blattella germanica]|nr:hypothetical protein C0J52_22073 [Blattella germanica]
MAYDIGYIKGGSSTNEDVGFNQAEDSLSTMGQSGANTCNSPAPLQMANKNHAELTQQQPVADQDTSP